MWLAINFTTDLCLQ